MLPFSAAHRPRTARWHEWCSGSSAHARPMSRFGTRGAGARRDASRRWRRGQASSGHEAENPGYPVQLLERGARRAPRPSASRDRAVADRRHPVRDVHARADRCPHLPLSARGHAAVRAVRLGAARQELSRRTGARRTATCSLATSPASCEQGAAATLAIEGGSSDTRHRVELEAILLPLVHGGNKIARIIGAMSADVPALLARQRAPEAAAASGATS